MEGHDHLDCNTTLTLGLNQNERKTEIGSRAFLDLEIPCHSRLNFFEETDRERSKGDEEIDFFRNFSRKKLRLTNDQTSLLEYTFKQHSNLNTAQKEALAGKVGVKPRQVEVWFQNRRARSKLKQTVTEWQLLKKTCERLKEENCRLKKELVEATPWRYSFHFPKTERCPSCECMATRSNQP